MKKSIGIFRALDVRFTHAEFAASFSDIEPTFISQVPEEMKSYLTKQRTKYFDIPLQPVWYKDPVYPLLKKTDFTPWKAFDPQLLDEAIADLDFYQIYEPYFFYSSQIADLAHKNSVPLITEIWTSFPGHPSHYVPPYKMLVKNVIQKTDLFVLRTQKALSYLQPFTIPNHKKEVIYHGVALDRFYPAKKTEGKLGILFVGALDPHKGLDDLLEVFPGLAEKYPGKIELIVCGNGTLKSEVEKLSRDLPILYKGYVPNSKLPEVYRNAAIYCQPSKDYYAFGIKGGEEFAGYTFMEAMASGLPIVSTICGGIPEIVGKENSLIEQGNREVLYEALDRLLSSNELRKAIGHKNRERAEELFDIKKQTRLLEELIHERCL